MMKIIIVGNPDEIASFVSAMQGKQEPVTADDVIRQINKGLSESFRKGKSILEI